MSSAKTPNNLTDDQDMLTRVFLRKVVRDDRLWGDNPAGYKRVSGVLLQLLGYKPDSHGGLSALDAPPSKMAYGERPSGDWSLFDSDEALVRAALEAGYVTDEDSGADEAGPSESPEGDEVGDVLLEDV